MTDHECCGKHSCHKINGDLRVEFRIILPTARMPYRKRDTDSGYDLAAAEEIIIEPGELANVRSGVQVACCSPWYYTIEGRSSLWQQGIVPFRTIIDATYTGELVAPLRNLSKNQYHIKTGDRIAQLVFHCGYSADFVEVEEFSPKYDIRGINGYGSTGR